LLRLDRPSEALAQARQLLARDPRNVDALLVAGRAALALNAPAEAAQFLREAAVIQPDNEEIKQALSKSSPRP
jgi:cytochrome c-type biogenesis protein CcmH/NrfG